MAKKRYRMGVLTKTFLMFGAGVCGAVVVLSATLFFYMRDTTDLAVQELINQQQRPAAQCPHRPDPRGRGDPGQQ